MTNKYPTPTILINECQIFQLKQPIRKNYTPHHAFTRGLGYHFPSHLVVNLQNSLFLKSNISVCAFIQPYINFTRMKIFPSSISLNHGHYFGYIREAVYMLSGLLIVLVILSADSVHSIKKNVHIAVFAEQDHAVKEHTLMVRFRSFFSWITLGLPSCSPKKRHYNKIVYRVWMQKIQ